MTNKTEQEIKREKRRASDAKYNAKRKSCPQIGAIRFDNSEEGRQVLEFVEAAKSVHGGTWAQFMVDAAEAYLYDTKVTASSKDRKVIDAAIDMRY